MNSQLSKQIDIAKHIIDGSIAIDSIKEFEGMLQIFPNDPALHRAYSDMLTRKKQFRKAVDAYQKSAALYIDSGKMLPAILCKILQWHIKKPSHQEARQFYDELLSGNYHETLSKVFLSRLAFSELFALMNHMERVRLPAGQTIKKIGDVENALFLVVSGSLKLTVYQPLKKNESNHQKSIN